ncbi:hypothetical protein L2E82_16149 [Cichorium intybus]|uniref:Uncharacterized protein n=1 Tax=Cichorium intybus TaxID=13427 RepID=A0ACB9F4S4_CICIN|nr:hypothetical protein L2E82_16149 [Cichorium intybus]
MKTSEEHYTVFEWVDHTVNDHYRKTLLDLKTRSNGVALLAAERQIAILEANMQSKKIRRAKEQQAAPMSISALHEEEKRLKKCHTFEFVIVFVIFVRILMGRR